MSKVPATNNVSDVQQSFREVYTALDKLLSDLHGQVLSNAGDARKPTDLATLGQVMEQVAAAVKSISKDLPAPGYDQIQDEGVALAKRHTLNIIGGGVVAADDGNAGGRTNVTVQTASTTLEGTVTTGTQTLAGNKTLNGTLTVHDGTSNVLIGQTAAGAGYGAIGLANSITAGGYNFTSNAADTNLYINRPTGKGISFRENNGSDQMAILTGGQVAVYIATGTSPFAITSTTQVNNLNVNFLEGKTWEIPGTIGSTTPNTGKFTTVQSTVATGTAPLIVASTTQVSNLNVSQLEGATWEAPGTIGSTTPNSGAFTTASVNSASTNGGSGVVTFGNNAQIGNAANANLQAPAKGTGSGPATFVAVFWLELDIQGTKYWFPLYQ